MTVALNDTALLADMLRPLPDPVPDKGSRAFFFLSKP